MNCKNSLKKVSSINGLSGVSHTDIENAKIRIRFFLGLMEKVLMDKDLQPLRGKAYTCVENLVLQQGHFFDGKQTIIHTTSPFESSLKLAQVRDRGYCEGFVLPWDGGIPSLHAWVFDKTNKKIYTSQEGLHYGIAFTADFIIQYFQETGIVGVFKPNQQGKVPILDKELPIGSLMK